MIHHEHFDYKRDSDGRPRQADWEAIQKFCDDKFGRIDVVVNNVRAMLSKKSAIGRKLIEIFALPGWVDV